MFADPARTALFERSMELLCNGYSLLPFRITPEGNKVPSIFTDLSEYRRRQPTDEEVFSWLEDPAASCISIVTGPVSGGFVALDFDHHAFFELWAGPAREVCRTYPEARGVVVEDTRKGVHVGFRVSSPDIVAPKRQILAAYQSRSQPFITLANGRQRPNIKVGIELLAGGSACICSPSAAGVYKIRRGSYSEMPVLSDDVAMMFLDLARGLDRRPEPMRLARIERRFEPATQDAQRESLIHAFNTRFDIRDVLQRNGYTMRPSRIDFIRPGGSHDTVQLAIGSGGFERAKALNTNDPLWTAPGDGAHDAFSCFVVLEHDGDELAALREARRLLAQE